jgi:hypothetical protein
VRRNGQLWLSIYVYFYVLVFVCVCPLSSDVTREVHLMWCAKYIRPWTVQQV